MDHLEILWIAVVTYAPHTNQGSIVISSVNDSDCARKAF